MNDREMYVSPELLVIELNPEGVFCTSGDGWGSDSDDSEF